MRIKTTVRRRRIVYTECEQDLQGGAKCTYWCAHTLRGTPLHHGERLCLHRNQKIS